MEGEKEVPWFTGNNLFCHLNICLAAEPWRPWSAVDVAQVSSGQNRSAELSFIVYFAFWNLNCTRESWLASLINITDCVCVDFVSFLFIFSKIILSLRPQIYRLQQCKQLQQETRSRRNKVLRGLKVRTRADWLKLKVFIYYSVAPVLFGSFIWPAEQIKSVQHRAESAGIELNQVQFKKIESWELKTADTCANEVCKWTTCCSIPSSPALLQWASLARLLGRLLGRSVGGKTFQLIRWLV